MIPKFKDKKVDKLIIQYGACYTVKDKYINQLSSPFQKVVFAIEASGDILNELKDISPNLFFISSRDKKIKIMENSVITTTADIYDNANDFLSIYDETSEKIAGFLAEYQESRKQSQTNKNKAVSRPRRK